SVRTPAFTVATILSITCCAAHVADNASTTITTVITRFIMTISERLRDAEMQIAAMQPKHRRCSVKRDSIRPTLRNQKLRRVQQEPVVNCQRAAERSLQTKA